MIAFLKINLLFLIILVNGCSFIEKSSSFENQSHNEWKRDHYWTVWKNCNFLNKYENDNYEIYIIPRRLQTARILYGPAYFLPFIPNIFHFWPESNTPRYAENFSIKVIINNKYGKINADLSNITFEFDEEIYNPVAKKLDVFTGLNRDDSVSENRYFGRWVENEKTGDDSLYYLQIMEFGKNELVTERKYIAIQYEFDYETIRIDEIKISFNNFFLEPKYSSIPILELKSKNYYEYIPFEFGH